MIRCEVRCDVPYIKDVALAEEEAQRSQRMIGSRVNITDWEHAYGKRIIVDGQLCPRASACGDLDVSSTTTCVSLRDIEPPTEEKMIEVGGDDDFYSAIHLGDISGDSTLEAMSRAGDAAVGGMLSYVKDFFSSSRRPSREVMVGGLGFGASHPVRVQSMITSDTMDTAACVKETLRLVEVGCEMVRITAPTVKDAANLRNIRFGLNAVGCTVPLVADIHFKPEAALEAALWDEKVRINPGNFADSKKFNIRDYSDAEYADELERIRERFTPLVKLCQERDVALRIGTNHGSLSDRIMNRFGDSPRGMVESALEFARIARDLNFHQMIFSMKASNPKVMIAAYRLLVARLDPRHPILLKDTLSPHFDGEFLDHLLTSAIVFGSLLCDGIGDAILLRSEEAPGQSLRLAYNILQASGVRIFKTDYVACPSCGRTLFNLQETTARIKASTSHLKGVRIAVMGCIVNGPGEMADADFGYVGGAPGKVNLYVGKQAVKFNIPEGEALERLVDLIKEHGRWMESPAASQS